MGIIDKCSSISGVAMKSLTKLKNYMNMIHSDDLYLDMKEGKTISEIDTFEGKIYISLENNEIKYKFIPSAEFNKLIVDTVNKRESGLIKSLDESVIKAMSNIYENLI